MISCWRVSVVQNRQMSPPCVTGGHFIQKIFGNLNNVHGRTPGAGIKKHS